MRGWVPPADSFNSTPSLPISYSPEMLFDLSQDETESHDLSSINNDIMKNMRRVYRRRIKEAKEKEIWSNAKGGDLDAITPKDGSIGPWINDKIC